MKKVLLQLDTDRHPSPFDAIVAHDAGVDVLLSHGEVTPDAVRDLVQGAFFTRAPGDSSMAVWVGGSDVGEGEKLLDEVKATYFGPFRLSAMLDSDGCNTTAATAIAMIAKDRDLGGRRAVVLGVGPVGLRSASLLAQEGCEVLATSIPGDVLGVDSYRRPRGLAAAERLPIDAREVADRAEMEAALEGANIVLAAGPAGVEVVREEVWSANPAIELLADYNAAEPLGIEGVEAGDELVEREGKLVLGALGIGGQKMKVHKACVRRLFERSDLVLNADGVYAVAREIV
ncbi:MAG TPA: methylene-tetrahydromethanopterin dehydrogenase N-terminal domain-containing protein [Thermoleophilaceae bacterium]|nr:methylene-tetrahydromethanopterin dehydrogenase N-terminal domain-containing protein [Thermoleophilaceae bacterium]